MACREVVRLVLGGDPSRVDARVLAWVLVVRLVRRLVLIFVYRLLTLSS